MRFFVSDTRKWLLSLMLGTATILALGGLGHLYEPFHDRAGLAPDQVGAGRN